MFGLLSISIAVAASLSQATEATLQRSSGPCSPNIANVRGNVTVNCIGVDPRALTRLNTQLSRTNLRLAEKVREANDWAAHYKELEAEFSAAGSDSALSRQAQELLHAGELEKAGAILDKVLAEEQKQTRIAAADHYDRALLYQLEFQPRDALPQMKTAYLIAEANGDLEDQVKYEHAYGRLLIKEHDYSDAEPILLSTLEGAKKLSASKGADADEYRSDALNNLGIVYEQTRRLKEAEDTYEELLSSERRAVKGGRAQSVPLVATVLGNLANIYYETGRFDQAEAALLESSKIFKQLASQDPDLYLSYEADSLGILAILYRAINQPAKAEASYLEAIGILRQLDRTHPGVYQGDLARTLANLGVLYHALQRDKDAEKAYDESLAMVRPLAIRNPQENEEALANALNNVGMMYGDEGRVQEAEKAFEESLAIRRRLVATTPSVYQSDLAESLNNLAGLYRMTDRKKEAQDALQESLGIRRQLAEANPTVYRPQVADSLRNLADLEGDSGQTKDAIAALQEALGIYRELAKADEVRYGLEAQDVLSDLAVSNMRLGNQPIAAQEIMEAVNINRGLRKTNPAFPKSYLLKSLLLAIRIEREMGAECELAKEAEKLATEKQASHLEIMALAFCENSGPHQ